MRYFYFILPVGLVLLFFIGKFEVEPDHLNFFPPAQEKISDGPIWLEGRYFPCFIPAEKIYSLKVNCPIRGEGTTSDPTWRIDRSFEVSASLTLVGMQGIINRDEASLFIHWQDSSNTELVTSYNTWNTLIKDNAVIEELNFEHQEAISFLLSEFGYLFNGLVVYDLGVPETINLATMIAGLENRIIVGPHQLSWPAFDTMNNIRDLRELVQAQGWQADFDSQLPIYQWVYDSLWPDLEHRMIGFESPGPPTSIDRETINDGFFFPLAIATRDYDVALKLPVLYLNPKYDDHKVLLEKFFDEVPSPTPVTGVSAFNEFGVVETASQHGHFVVASSWPGQALSCGNLTVWSSIRPEIIMNGPDLDPVNILATVQKPGPFTTLFSSDGDAIFFQMDKGFIPFFQWDDVKGQPFNWETNPILSELAPVIWNYYQNDRSGTPSIAGLSAAGYTRPQPMDSLELENYLSIAASYLAETGLRVVRIDGNDGPINERIAKQYYNLLKESGLLGTIVSFLPGSTAGLNLKYFDNPVPTMQETFTINAANQDEVRQALFDREPQRSRIEIGAFGNVPEVQEVIDPEASGGKAVRVEKGFFQSPSYSLIYATGPLTLEPGNYTVTHFLKVEENSDTKQIANLYAGQSFQNPDWTLLGNRTVRPVDFDEENTYQGFSYEFSLNGLTPEIEFRVDYGEGGTDLWADIILLENDNEDVLPVYGLLYMSLGIDPDLFDGMNTLAADFAGSFEAEGGLILSGNEFFASVNPEYMIAFAEGLDHDESMLELAKEQFADRQYYNSLISARKSLRNTVITDLETISFDKDYKFRIFPNPFLSEINLTLELKNPEKVGVKLYDLHGRLVINVIDQNLPAGNHSFSREMSFPAQIYLVHLQVGRTSEMYKLTGL